MSTVSSSFIPFSIQELNLCLPHSRTRAWAQVSTFAASTILKPSSRKSSRCSAAKSQAVSSWQKALRGKAIENCCHVRGWLFQLSRILLRSDFSVCGPFREGATCMLLQPWLNHLRRKLVGRVSASKPFGSQMSQNLLQLLSTNLITPTRHLPCVIWIWPRGWGCLQFLSLRLSWISLHPNRVAFGGTNFCLEDSNTKRFCLSLSLSLYLPFTGRSLSALWASPLLKMPDKCWQVREHVG